MTQAGPFPNGKTYSDEPDGPNSLVGVTGYGYVSYLIEMFAQVLLVVADALTFSGSAATSASNAAQSLADANTAAANAQQSEDDAAAALAQVTAAIAAGSNFDPANFYRALGGAPSLVLAPSAGKLDPRLQTERNGAGNYRGLTGATLSAPANQPRLEWLANQNKPGLLVSEVAPTDKITMPLGDWFNPNEGMILVRFSTYDADETTPFRRVLQIDDGGNSNNISILFSPTPAPDQAYASIQVGGVVQTNDVSFGFEPLAADTDFVIGLTYKTNEAKVSINGSAVDTDTTIVVPSGLTTMRLGHSAGGANPLQGHIYDLVYLPFVPGSIDTLLPALTDPALNTFDVLAGHALDVRDIPIATLEVAAGDTSQSFPAFPIDGGTVEITYTGDHTANPSTIGRNGLLIAGEATDLTNDQTTNDVEVPPYRFDAAAGGYR